MPNAELSLPAPDPCDFQPYHGGRTKRACQTPPERRPFIAWDGEGINVDGAGKPQHYVLFGCSTGQYLESPTHLHTFDLLDFILKVGNENPSAFHVGFAFNYDANMVLRSLHPETLSRIHKQGGASIRRLGYGRYYIEFRPSKWFSVTRFGINYDRKTNPHDKTTVRIFDLFGFFQQSFVKAYTSLIGPVPLLVSQGKDSRGTFTDIEYVRMYWSEEIRMLQTLAEKLRALLYGAGLKITSWHGPGALASYSLRVHSIKEHMAIAPAEVREAARHGYAGGRFEMFRIGRTAGPVYSMDINSAYPHGISQLPSLSGGEWVESSGRPKRLARFGIYQVRLLPRSGDSFLERAVAPLFHRDKMGNISFPWILDGWYWSPEVRNLLRLHPDRYEIIRGYEFQRSGDSKFMPQGSPQKEAYPFLWVRDVYAQRQEWKSKGIAGQLALKLQLNSLYGKMAQRVGWNEEKRTPPTWHQLEWAGWVTSNTRAMLWEVMSRIPPERLIAVETDGLYTTMSPTELKICDSTVLGGWSVEVYDEILYVQSGLAWLRKGQCAQGDRCPHQDDKGNILEGCAWTCKRRGLDVHTFRLDQCINYLGTLRPNEQWAPYVGETTRFIGLGAALNATAPMKVRHCVWETVPREISPGKGGKRVHIPIQCDACKAGISPAQEAHDMSIRSLAYKESRSYPHDIPWEDSEDPGYEWREFAVNL